MNKNSRSRLLVFLLAAVLFVAAAVPAYAAMTGKDITVFSGVNIFVDGRELHPTDVKGNEVDAFIYEGTTYVPLRAVGEALGAEVSWNKETKTVYVNSEKTGNEPEDRIARFDAGSGPFTYFLFVPSKTMERSWHLELRYGEYCEGWSLDSRTGIHQQEC